MVTSLGGEGGWVQEQCAEKEGVVTEVVVGGVGTSARKEWAEGTEGCRPSRNPFPRSPERSSRRRCHRRREAGQQGLHGQGLALKCPSKR